MAIPLSNEIRALLDGPNFVHLATLMPDGSPQSAPVWVGREGDRILICTGEGRGVPLDMSRIHLECPDSVPPDRSVAADVLLRQEPDEEEDEEEDEGDGKEKEDDDDDDNGDGYSE
jgi:hypothetical protein